MGVDEVDLRSIVKRRTPVLWFVLIASGVVLLAVWLVAVGALMSGLRRSQDWNPMKVPIGSSMEEVRAALGEPGERRVKDDGGEAWHYSAWFVVYGLEFDARGILVHSWST